MTELNEIVGKVIAKIEGLEQGSDEVYISTTDGSEYKFFHYQDCCEDVRLVDFDNDIENGSDALILSAEEVENSHEHYSEEDDGLDSFTWTFYKIETNKGGLWLRWLGDSNGYYSESVDFEKVN